MTTDIPMHPIIVCLCGSTKHKDVFERVTAEETLAGRIVLAPGTFGQADGIEFDTSTLKMFDDLHRRKIDLADEVMILNVGGRIGKSTQGELEYALSYGKVIRYLKAGTI
jgi:hypothetical protein